jgi:hypothetical protein
VILREPLFDLGVGIVEEARSENKRTASAMSFFTPWPSL